MAAAERLSVHLQSYEIVKTSNVIFAILLIYIGFNLALAAQSPEKNLDQVELMKQFAGTWKAEVGDDTIISMSFKPFGIALEYHREVIIKVPDGEQNYYRKGIYGFSGDMDSVIFAGVEPLGTMLLDYGRFVSGKKYVSESYPSGKKHPIAVEEVVFADPDTMLVHSKSLDNALTRVALWSSTVRFIREE